jgi:DNA polymerase-3 subunit delta'
MDGARTRGQPAAVEAIRSMVAGSAPHAVLLSGPAGVGKTTLALDFAAALLCTPADGANRPCRACRACRMVEHGNHPDLHWLQPEGPGGQVVIGGPDARYRGVRDLIAELALHPVEGGARVAVIEHADRMNEDAQSALLKTLEEPPRGVTIVLCADDEDRLLPTVRSRCARVRLGPVGSRAIEAILEEHGAADGPTAARLGRLAGGRPGLALAYAGAPEAATIRRELARTLLDLVDARISARFEAMRGLVPRTAELVAALEAVASPSGPAPGGPSAGRATGRGRGRGRTAAAPVVAVSAVPAAADVADADADGGGAVAVVDEGPRAVPAAERRRGAATLIAIWTDLSRDLALVGLGERAAVRHPDMLEELEAVAGALPPAVFAGFLERLARAGERLESNVAPELLLDSLLLAWPRRTRTG